MPHLPSGLGEKQEEPETDSSRALSPFEEIVGRMPRAPVRLPDKLTLQLLIETLPVMRIAEHYGTSDKRIAKLCVEYEIEKPKRGDWTKRKAYKRLKEAE